MDRFHFEREHHARGLTRLAGVDEAGRGPLAGPVVATAAAIAGAVSAATGATFDKLPLMPEYVLERIEAASATV